MLDLDPNREGVTPVEAATLILLRNGPAGPEVFCVERNRKSAFMGGAIVFPGGKLDAGDRNPSWVQRSTPPRTPQSPFGADESTLRALAVAACRETLEEAAILPVEGGTLTHQERLDLRARLAGGKDTLLDFLAARGLRLDLARLHPFARWITPVQEARRFDARFFVAEASGAEPGAHDAHETMSSFWARPNDVLSRFAAGELQLAPPTHRTLEMLQGAASPAKLLEHAKLNCLEPICPRLVVHRDAAGETLALTLPGDPEHEVKTARVPGRSRFVLRRDRWLPEDPP
jgi:8-oxo-dGTP pyrophosphatase MutT (NUDIX family)